MSRRWVPHDTRDQIVDYVNRWTVRTEISAQQLLGWAGIPVPTFTGWRKNYGLRVRAQRLDPTRQLADRRRKAGNHQVPL
ncbi:MAG UNVERIFIED_CONTAM: hypothetical protein LVR18_31270 [Planctomycetaceae bacterium]